jgi:hypothetical protein
MTTVRCRSTPCARWCRVRQIGLHRHQAAFQVLVPGFEVWVLTGHGCRSLRQQTQAEQGDQGHTTQQHPAPCESWDHRTPSFCDGVTDWRGAWFCRAVAGGAGCRHHTAPLSITLRPVLPLPYGRGWRATCGGATPLDNPNGEATSWGRILPRWNIEVRGSPGSLSEGRRSATACAAGNVSLVRLSIV